MKIVGILGDIGSGKSFISKKFNCPVFNADKEVSKIYNKNYSCFRKLNKAFPNNIKKFPIIKIVHPLVRIRMNHFLSKNKYKKLVVLDIPLLIENKLHKKNFILVYVEADKKKIQSKLKNRNNFNEKIYKELKRIQIPLKIKKKMANYLIYNNFKKNNILKNVKIIKNEILKK